MDTKKNIILQIFGLLTVSITIGVTWFMIISCDKVFTIKDELNNMEERVIEIEKSLNINQKEIGY